MHRYAWDLVVDVLELVEEEHNQNFRYQGAWSVMQPAVMCMMVGQRQAFDDTQGHWSPVEVQCMFRGATFVVSSPSLR